ncbi:RtcB family protein [bacterium]|nr:RtcB family protein [bacterium]
MEVLKEISKHIYEIPKSYRQDMRVPARAIMSREMLQDVLQDSSLWQLVNVASLPGIVKCAFAMPDIHQGYGFPIGGVAATDIENSGVISPGGIGYDINCGVRLLSLPISAKELGKHLEKLASSLFSAVPSGVGRGGKEIFKGAQLDRILQYGASELVSMGYGTQGDLEFCEEGGYMKSADPTKVSERAKQRGQNQIGTLGAGNHFLEVQVIHEIFDEKIAQTFGLQKGNVCIMVHCGSRGLGHQTCSDHVKNMVSNLDKWKLKLADLELACAPFNSKQGQDYFGAMSASANFAWANRHMIGHHIRNVCKSVLGGDVLLKTVYDVSHNIGKVEDHVVDGKACRLLVHRKGATRAFAPGMVEVPQHYRSVGQPVLIPGTMGTCSYVLAGTKTAMDLTFGSTCHGAGRRLSRTKARKEIHVEVLRKQLEGKGILVKGDSNKGLAEEAPFAYKDVNDVVKVIHETGIAKMVVRLKPLVVIKG